MNILLETIQNNFLKSKHYIQIDVLEKNQQNLYTWCGVSESYWDARGQWARVTQVFIVSVLMFSDFLKA